MAHRSGAIPAEFEEVMRKFAQGNNLGSTGDHPGGSVEETEEGPTKLTIFTSDSLICVDLNEPRDLIGFTPTEARELASVLVKYADEIQGLVPELVTGKDLMDAVDKGVDPGLAEGEETYPSSCSSCTEENCPVKTDAGG